MGNIETRLAELGLSLPAPKAPVANYLSVKQSGDLLFVSARVSPQRGEVGTEVSLDEAIQAAESAALELLAIIQAAIGDLNQIVSIEKVQGFVRSAPSFVDQPKVIDGASNLLIALFGEAGRHARTATGAAQLPFGACVQLDLVARVRPYTVVDAQP